VVVDGYVRVSQVRGRKGPSFISPAEQADQIEAWADLHRVQIAEVYEELDESGARADRPLLLRAIERVERGDTNGLVVARLDRFGRSLVDGLEAIERIRRAGGTFVSVQDGFDIRTPTGKLVLRLMLSMAEFELDRMRANFAAARSRAIGRGTHIGPCAPLGYRRGADKRLHPDPTTAPHVRELFRLRAENTTWREISAYLEINGVRTTAGNVCWSPSNVYAVVKNRAYRGEVRHGEFVNVEAHQPIVDELTWQRAQNPLGLTPPRGSARSLLAGLIRCASCRYALSSENAPRAHGSRQHRYRCPRTSASGRCPAPVSVAANDIEPYVERLFFEALDSRAPERVFRRGQVRRRERELGAAEAALAAFRDDARVGELLDADEFVRGLGSRKARVDEARRELAFARAAEEAPPVESAHVLRKQWRSMPVEDRRLRLAQAIDCVVVRRGRMPIADRCHPFMKGEFDLDVPTRGQRRAISRPFEAPGNSDWWREDLRLITRWTEEEIERQLRPLLLGREHWPPPSVFRRAGRAALLDAVHRRGGSVTWAARMGVKPCPTMFDTGASRIAWD
jgi:DNA invertase Pin-like site-specific DNA recombinase